MLLGRRTVGVAGLLLAAAYVYAAGRNYIAARAGAVSAAGPLQRAIRLEPSNAEYRWKLGRYRFEVQQDAAAAIDNYLAAISLNPRSARYWLDLATAYEVTGDTENQGDALNKAVGADPTDPDVTWEAANFYVVRGDLAKALPLFRLVIQNDPDAIGPAIRICWSASGQDTQLLLDKVLPPEVDAHFALLNLLIGNGESAAAETVWTRILQLRRPIDSKQAFPYLDWLAEQKRYAELHRSWVQLVSAVPELKPYVVPDDLIVNGGFEYPILNGGMDWHYTPLPSVDLSIDSNEFHGGSRAFCIDFKGPAIEETGFSQVVPIQSKTRYRFTAFARAQDIISASGPRVVVEDASDGKNLVMTDDFLGTIDWRQIQDTFTTPAGAAAVRVTVLRSPSNTLIRGRFCLDDVSLSPQPVGGGANDAR